MIHHTVLLIYRFVRRGIFFGTEKIRRNLVATEASVLEILGNINNASPFSKDHNGLEVVHCGIHALAVQSLIVSIPSTTSRDFTLLYALGKCNQIFESGDVILSFLPDASRKINPKTSEGGLDVLFSRSILVSTKVRFGGHLKG